MSATAIFVVLVVAAAVLVAIGVITVAARRRPGDGPITGEFDRRAARADRAARRVREEGGAEATGVATLVSEDEAEESASTDVVLESQADPLLQREEISQDEYDETKRQFLNRAVLGLFGLAFLGGLTISFLAFLWPRLRGGFGTAVNVGEADAILEETLAGDGTIVPQFFAAAQTWVVPFPPDDLEGSSFEGLPVVAGGGPGEQGLMALWQRCVHLGCRVPSCVPSQGFECPCHGSRYNFHGEYEAGPAPRNLDRFEVAIDSSGNLIVNTGVIFETARASNKTIVYPQGPSCI